MIHDSKTTVHDYTAIIDGNGGENQLIITSVTRQDGLASMCVSEVSVDGAARWRLQCEVKLDEFFERVERSVYEWLCAGIPPKGKIQQMRVDGQLREVMTILHRAGWFA